MTESDNHGASAMAFTNLLILPLAGFLLCGLTRLWTTHRYKASFRNSSSLKEPAQVPYTIPWLGTAQDFLNRAPGAFYAKLFTRYPAIKDEGVATILVAGERLHIVTAPAAVRTLFKTKSTVANRDSFNPVIMIKACGMSATDYAKYAPVMHQDAQLNYDYVMRQKHANELGWKFNSCLGDLLSKEEAGREVDFYAWLQRLMFQASTETLLGSRLTQSYPSFSADFAVWDRHMLALFSGIPKFMNREAHAALKRCLDGMEEWIEVTDRATNSQVLDADDSEVAWEPNWGSRLGRARQQLWKDIGLSARGRASAELSLTIGLASNVIPITGWMLMHILDPSKPTLLPRCLEEIEQAVGTDGKLDTQILAGMPFLQACFHETLRLYTDALPTRELFEDVKLPLDKDGERWVLLKKGSRCIAPTLINQLDTDYFTNPPANVFSAERWLVPASSEKAAGTYTFTTAADAGRLWPWGGGKTVCPGRVFAKQEVLSATAMVLFAFDLEPVGEYGVPRLADAWPGSGGLLPGGDVRVQLKPRARS